MIEIKLEKTRTMISGIDLSKLVFPNCILVTDTWPTISFANNVRTILTQVRSPDSIQFRLQFSSFGTPLVADVYNTRPNSKRLRPSLDTNSNNFFELT